MSSRGWQAPWIALALSGSLAVGCAHTDGAGDRTLAAAAKAELTDFMPLAVGNRWTYATRFQGQDQADLSVSITGRQGPYFVDDRPRPSQYGFDAEGLRDGSQRYLLKLPLVEGTEWMSVADLNTVERYRIEAVERRVHVPAGVFDGCVTVRMEVRMDETHAMRNEMTFAPGVGIVEIRTLLLEGARAVPQSQLQLKTYSIQP